MNPILSILIPTVVGREGSFLRLMKSIDSQVDVSLFTHQLMSGFSPIEGKVCRIIVNPHVEICVFKDSKEITIGQKREDLYREARGKYSWQIDDDDAIEAYALDLILEAIDRNPGIACVTFKECCMINGVYKSSNHSIKYDRWQDNFDGYDYVRCPFYKDVIRTDIAQSAPFPHIRYNEDEQWSMAIKPLLTSEVHIDEELYHYIYEPRETHQERYGFDKE